MLEVARSPVRIAYTGEGIREIADYLNHMCYPLPVYHALTWPSRFGAGSIENHVLTKDQHMAVCQKSSNKYFVRN